MKSRKWSKSNVALMTFCNRKTGNTNAHVSMIWSYNERCGGINLATEFWYPVKRHYNDVFRHYLQTFKIVLDKTTLTASSSEPPPKPTVIHSVVIGRSTNLQEMGALLSRARQAGFNATMVSETVNK